LRPDNKLNLIPPLVVALDYPEAGPALEIARKLLGRAAYVKVGLELYTAEGPDVVTKLRDMGHQVFLDLKLHDIPNTVAGAVAAAARAGAALLTVHTSGGKTMLQAAADAAAEASGVRASASPAGNGSGGGPRLRLLGVTVLTSLDQAGLAATGVAGHVIDQVLRLAALAADARLDGVVVSPREAAQLRAAHGPPFLVVTPGVRPVWASAAGDQSRVATPRRAVLSGADLVVVGRPVTRADDPDEAARRVGAELLEAVRERGRPRPFGEELRPEPRG